MFRIRSVHGIFVISGARHGLDSVVFVPHDQDLPRNAKERNVWIMMTRKRFCILLLIFFLLLPTVTVTASADSSLYHAPMLTILTGNAPSDLSIEFLLHRKDGTVLSKLMQKKTRVWEQQFRLYREDFVTVRAWFRNNYDLKNAEIVLISGENRITIPLTQELTEQMSMNDLLMLNYKTATLTLGDPFWRGPLLMVLRILLAVGLTVLVFRLRSYTEGRSLVIAGGTALVCFFGLNLLTSKWLNFDIREVIAYGVFCVIALLVQTLAHVCCMEERTPDERLNTTLLAFVVTVVTNTLWLFCLPV